MILHRSEGGGRCLISSGATDNGCTLIIACGHLLFEVSHQRNLQLSLLLSAQRIRHDRCRHRRLNLSSSCQLLVESRRTDHLQCATDDPLEDLGVAETALERFLGQLDEIRERILVKDERKRGLELCCRDGVMYEGGGDAKEGAEGDLERGR